MKALVIHEIKQFPRWEEISAPEPKTDEVVVSIKAAALNRRDYWITQGMYPGMMPQGQFGMPHMGMAGMGMPGQQPQQQQQQAPQQQQQPGGGGGDAAAAGGGGMDQMSQQMTMGQQGQVQQAQGGPAGGQW